PYRVVRARGSPAGADYQEPGSGRSHSTKRARPPKPRGRDGSTSTAPPLRSPPASAPVATATLAAILSAGEPAATSVASIHGILRDKMSHPRFQGVFPALLTPFSDGAVDEDAFVRLVERQIAGGVHGLVPAGTTGEASTLSHEEHRRVVELCVRTAAGRVPV